MKKSIFIFCSIMLLYGVAIPLIGPTDALAESLSDAIAKVPQGTGEGQIDPKAAPGYLGIAGAPDINLIIGLLWAIWVGWIFSKPFPRARRIHPGHPSQAFKPKADRLSRPKMPLRILLGGGTRPCWVWISILPCYGPPLSLICPKNPKRARPIKPWRPLWKLCSWNGSNCAFMRMPRRADH